MKTHFMFICTTVDILANSHPAFSCMFLETCPFLLGCWIYWLVTVHSIFLGFFVCFSIVSVVTSPLWFLILSGLSLFSFWWAWLEVFYFVYSFKKLSPGLMNLCLKKKKHKKHLFISLTFIIFFLLLTLGFALFLLLF